VISLDTETTGSDFRHGARPYFVTVCSDDGDIRYWEWEVDPLSRKVFVPDSDRRELENLLAGIRNWGTFAEDVRQRHRVVGQNIKFDAHALCSLGIGPWPWDMTDDTLLAGHLLASSLPHDLTRMVMQYLEEDIEPFEDRLEGCIKEARRFASRHLPDWAIAEKGREDMPSAKEKTWKVDGWLPRAVAKRFEYPIPLPDCIHSFAKDRICVGCGGHEYWTILRDYSNTDSAYTLKLWFEMRRQLEGRGYLAHYRHRMELDPVLWQIESRGVTSHAGRHRNQYEEYSATAQVEGKTLVDLAAEDGYLLELPKGNRNNSLTNYCFGYAIGKCDRCGYEIVLTREQSRNLRPLADKKTPCRQCLQRRIEPQGIPTITDYPCLDLPVIKVSEDTGNPSLDKEVISDYLTSVLPHDSKQHRFIKALAAKRKRDNSLQFLASYEKYWRVLGEDEPANPWRILYPSINPTGTDTLRLSCSNPNAQQVDKHPDNQGFSLRSVFGPAPGREWWPIDYENLELRIPAFEAGEEELMRVFLHPDDPPYFGSYHLVIFDLLHPKVFKEFGALVKDIPEYKATLYQWIKNGNFAVLYGAQEAKADATYHVKGAYKLIRHRFPKMASLSDRMVQFANKNGYVETIPNSLIGAGKGYPLMVTRSERGQVEPTKPLNYHVQGTACETANIAVVLCSRQLDEWRAESGFDAWIPLYVHDELVFDLPKGGKKNLPKVRRLARLMESVGEGINIPLKAAWKYCPESWAKSEEPK
jgi:DNA polymerase I-like protein with 3'-5' exonuclease and polymerase domains